MSTQTAVIVLGTSGLATARAIATNLLDSKIHGFAKRVQDADVLFEEPMHHIHRCFENGQPIIGVCASGILIRAVASVLSDKREEPPVIAVSEDGSSVVPLLGGYHGANELARELATALQAHPAITTAGDVSLGIALDAPPTGWHLANPEDAKDVTARLLAGETVSVDASLDWLDTTGLKTANDAQLKLRATINTDSPQPGELLYTPRKVVIGVIRQRLSTRGSHRSR